MTGLPSIAVISNLGSTRNLRDASWIEAAIAGESGVRHLPFTAVRELPEILRACGDADVLVVNGGDGTAGLVFDGLIESEPGKSPPIALLPGGKTNMTAAAWGLRGDARQALATLLRLRREGTLFDHVREQAVLRLRLDDRAPPLYGAFFGAAAFVDVIQFCRSYIYPLGLPNALSHALAVPLTLGRNLLGYGSDGTVSIQAGSRASADRYFLVAVTTLDEMMFGLRPAPTEAPAPNTVHLLGVRRSAAAILGLVPVVMSGRFTPEGGRIARTEARVTLSFTGAYTLDGELYQANAGQPLVLEAGPKLPFIRLAVA